MPHSDAPSSLGSTLFPFLFVGILIRVSVLATAAMFVQVRFWVTPQLVPAVMPKTPWKTGQFVEVLGAWARERGARGIDTVAMWYRTAFVILDLEKYRRMSR